jgi:DUF4097 and DUF4098 domain-containing protein YvlB
MKGPSMRLSVWLFAAAALSAACDVQVDEHGIRRVRVAEGRAEDVWSRTYTLPANGTLEVVGQDGAIHVRAADGPEIEVRAEREAQASSDEQARALLQTSQIQEEVTPTSVRITSVGTSDRGLGRSRVKVEYRVAVPAGLALTFKTENGGVRLNNVNGRMNVATTNGGITGEDLAGSLTAETVNGVVRVDLASIAGDVVVSATNGGVRLTVPPTARITLEASVINGGIDVDDEFGTPSGEGPTQRFSATVNGGGPKVSATSVNGEIRIRARELKP